MKLSPIVAAIGAAVLVVIGFLVGKSSSTTHKAPNAAQSSQESDAQPVPAVSMAVEAVNPEPTQIDDNLSASGVVQPKSVAEISSKTQGVIEQVLVDVGDAVRAGQTLAILDDSTMMDNVTQARADFESAKAALAQARADLARVEPLLKIDAISRQQVDSYRTALAQAVANHHASQARLNTAQKTLKDTHIKTSVSGVISAKTAQVGMSAAGSLFTIIKNNQLEWQATINPALASQIRQGMTAHISVGDEVVTGVVSHLSPTANQGRELIVHVNLPYHPALKAGMYQMGKFILGQTNAFTIPITAVMNTDGYDYVWRLVKTDKSDIYQVKRQKITILDRQNDRMATDLSPDVLIVASGVNFLSDDEWVKVATIATQSSHATTSNGSDNEKGQ